MGCFAGPSPAYTDTQTFSCGVVAIYTEIDDSRILLLKGVDPRSNRDMFTNMRMCMCVYVCVCVLIIHAFKRLIKCTHRFKYLPV